jgi:hypothetical protein
MAKKTVLTSDLTGAEITNPVVIALTVGVDRYLVDADQSDEIVASLTAVGRKGKKRGRPKTKA